MLRTAALVATALGAAQVAQAQPAKTATAVRAEASPEVDGALDDPAWASARFVSDFRQKQPVEGAPPSSRTEVAFVYDDEALYVGARMFHDGRVQAPMTRRDDTGTAERIIVSFDPFLDRRTAYSFAVTAAGVRADWIHPDDDEYLRDHSYDPVWEAEIAREPGLWTAEMRIPFSQLRFPDRDAHVWGLNLNRYVPHRDNEDLFWIVVPRSQTGWSSHFGRLVGIRDLPPTRRIEIVPYLATDWTTTSRALLDADDPFAERHDVGARAGVDAEIGLGPNVTLDATVHPDFGQVEADPAVVNLTAFETTFTERRPFFVEGSQLLSGGGPTHYYSRRIGAAPRGDLDADFVDMPLSTPILGAAKLTGRLPSRLSIGALSALTARTEARVYDVATGEADRVVVEPLTSYNLVRVQKEFGPSSSHVGATLTGVGRQVDGELGDQFARAATTGGVHWNLRTDDAGYELGGHLDYSLIRGREAAIARLQRASSHYFQRPDQDHVRFDPQRNQLAGWAAGLYGGKRSGAWRFSGTGFAESPGFDLDTMGLSQATDDVGVELIGGYHHTDPGRLLRDWNLNLSGFQEWNFGGDRNPAYVSFYGGSTFDNFWGLGGYLDLQAPGVDDRMTRGGPLVELGWGVGGGLSLSNSYASRHSWTVGLDWDASETGVSGASFYGELSFAPIDRLRVILAPRYVHVSDARQYVETIADPAATETFGARYVFAEVARREIAVQARLQLAFTPDLAVELYAEPFASSGAYSGFGELPAPASRTLRRYGEDGTSIERADGVVTVTDAGDTFSFSDPAFTVLSLRSTAVLRWEFRPGSTLFLVWQQSRTDAGAFTGRASLGDLAESATSPGRHTIALKLTYWWSAG